MADVTVADVAGRLGVTVQYVRTLVAAGEIAGTQLSNGMWLIDSRSVAGYELVRRGKGRQLATASAWGLLWELSGLTVAWLTPSTLARVRRRVRQSSSDQIVRAVSRRAMVYRSVAANPQTAQADLIATGRRAASDRASGLLRDARRVAGYVREGSVEVYAAAHFMVADPAGQDLLYVNTLPVDYPGRVMPKAVVAADLAASTDTRERSAGLAILEELRRAWLAAH